MREREKERESSEIEMVCVRQKQSENKTERRKKRGGRQGGKRHTQKEVGRVTESCAVKEREGREAGAAGKRRREARP